MPKPTEFALQIAAAILTAAGTAWGMVEVAERIPDPEAASRADLSSLRDLIEAEHDALRVEIRHVREILEERTTYRLPSK